MKKRIKATEAYENRFYRIPKAFFKTDKYKNMSLEAKVIYGFLDDRRELSLKNKWIDEEGYIYLIFTRKEIQEMLCLSDKPVTRAFKELKKYDLIDEVRQGLNKPNLIYVCHIDFENIENMRNRKFSESRNGDNPNQGSEDIRCIDTDSIEPDSNEPEKSIYITYPGDAHPFFFIYNKWFKRYFSKNHMRLTEQQYSDLYYWIKDLEDVGLEETDFEDAVREHFESLPKSNNGNILAFMEASMRYFEIAPDEVVKNTAKPKKKQKGNFNNFEQRNYNFDKLEKGLLGIEKVDIEDLSE